MTIEQKETLEIQWLDSVAVVWLNRPDIRNAMNDVMIRELRETFDTLGADPNVRAIVLAGRGKAFCAGGDLNYMRKVALYSQEQNQSDAFALAQMLNALATSPKPTIARVHGACYAGGLGLATACDIMVVAQEATFALTEVRVGLIPATISPYVVRAMGYQAARRFFLTAEVLDAATAYRVGMAHELCMADEIDTTVNELLGQLMLGAPNAIADTKRLVLDVSGEAVSEELRADTAARIAKARCGDEAREGIAAFLEKRAPAWQPAPAQSA
jgi:methylglutaconyl-CoA hydratase